ncbi:hypothetical protein ACIA7S_28630 [Streptomyces sp. NPDC051643]|uniref:hypothetical protein n=1 Tax=Streptomyces sp. NPDC051643 TaxID=3365665 RepID=UPI0037B424F2
MLTSLCKHGFPIQPPHGTLEHPGDCTDCGITYTAWMAVLEEQAAQQRMHSAARGVCELCGSPRMLFDFTRQQRAWDDEPPKSRRVCMQDWSALTDADDRGDFLLFEDAYEHGTDDQVLAFLTGTTR